MNRVPVALLCVIFGGCAASTPPPRPPPPDPEALTALETLFVARPVPPAPAPEEEPILDDDRPPPRRVLPRATAERPSFEAVPVDLGALDELRVERLRFPESPRDVTSTVAIED